MANNQAFVAGDMVVVDLKPIGVGRASGRIVKFTDLDTVLVDFAGDGVCVEVPTRVLILHPHSRIHHTISGTRYTRSTGCG